MCEGDALMRQGWKDNDFEEVLNPVIYPSIFRVHFYDWKILYLQHFSSHFLSLEKCRLVSFETIGQNFDFFRVAQQFRINEFTIFDQNGGKEGVETSDAHVRKFQNC